MNKQIAIVRWFTSFRSRRVSENKHYLGFKPKGAVVPAGTFSRAILVPVILIGSRGDMNELGDKAYEGVSTTKQPTCAGRPLCNQYVSVNIL